MKSIVINKRVIVEFEGTSVILKAPGRRFLLMEKELLDVAAVLQSRAVPPDVVAAKTPTFDEMPALIASLVVEISNLKTSIAAMNTLHLSDASHISGTEQGEQELLTRQQVARMLKISLPTLNEFTKTGKIQAHRIGSRVRYKHNEVVAALASIKA